MDLRQYQADAVASAYQYLRANPGRNPCVVLPTGAGKTPVLATGYWSSRMSRNWSSSQPQRFGAGILAWTSASTRLALASVSGPTR